jgi:hypothetical protein
MCICMGICTIGIMKKMQRIPQICVKYTLMLLDRLEYLFFKRNFLKIVKSKSYDQTSLGIDSIVGN